MIVSDTVRQRRARTLNRDNSSNNNIPERTSQTVLPDLLPATERSNTRDSIHSIRAFNLECPEVETIHIEVSSDTSGSTPQLDDRREFVSPGEDDSPDEMEYDLEKEVESITRLNPVELRPSSSVIAIERQRISYEEKRKQEQEKERDILKDSEENLDLDRMEIIEEPRDSFYESDDQDDDNISEFSIDMPTDSFSTMVGLN